MKWQKEALERLEQVPAFVRNMAKKGIEKHAKEQGAEEVTPALVEEAKRKYLGILDRDKNKKVRNVAVVRCHIVSEVCPGVGCLKAFASRRVHFEGYDENTELIGFFTCGGCSGRRVSRLVDKLVDYGVDVIHLASCILFDGDYPKCPFKQQIKDNIQRKGVTVVEGTHH